MTNNLRTEINRDLPAIVCAISHLSDSAAGGRSRSGPPDPESNLRHGRRYGQSPHDEYPAATEILRQLDYQPVSEQSCLASLPDRVGVQEKLPAEYKVNLG